MSEAKQEFERIRLALEAADDALAEALEARVRAVDAFAELQREAPDAYLRLPRRSDVLGRLDERVKRFPKTALHAVMTEVLSACDNLSAPVEVVYVGLEGGFGHLAARTHFGPSATLRAVSTPEEVLSEVERGNASSGLLPFETSYDGTVTGTLNLLARSEVKIGAEISIHRAFHLLGHELGEDGPQRIYGSPSALSACETYLRTRCPHATVIDVHTGLVAADKAKQEPGAAALCTDVVADLSGLTYLERSVEDVKDLETRYVVVGHAEPPRTGNDRTGLVLALHDAPGILIDCLKPFAERGINIYRLETRPARGWEFRYLILIEVDGHLTDRAVLSAIEELRSASLYVKVLGSYPRRSGA